MNSYVILIRGINVGGKNKISMVELKQCLEKLGFSHVITYIASGNVLVQSNKQPNAIKNEIEAALPTHFKLDSELIKVLVLTQTQLQSIVDNKPPGFGEQPKTYHSDAIFLMGIDANQALPVFKPNADVDKIWPGDGVIYSQRISALRTKSHLNRIIGTKAYKEMTIRNWNTTTKLLDLLKATYT